MGLATHIVVSKVHFWVIWDSYWLWCQKTHIVVSKVHFWVVWESGKFGLKKGTGVDPRPPLVDNVPFFYRFFFMRASLRVLSKTWHCITLESWTAQNIPIKKRAKKCRQGSPHFSKKSFFPLILIPYNTSHAIWRSVTSICKTPF